MEAGIEPVPDGSATLSVTVDCERADTLGLAGASEVAWVRECVRLPAAMRWRYRPRPGTLSAE